MRFPKISKKKKKRSADDGPPDSTLQHALLPGSEDVPGGSAAAVDEAHADVPAHVGPGHAPADAEAELRGRIPAASDARLVRPVPATRRTRRGGGGGGRGGRQDEERVDVHVQIAARLLHVLAPVGGSGGGGVQKEEEEEFS